MLFWPVVLGKRAGRGALKLLKRPARFERRLVSQRRMRSDGVVIVAPERQLPAGVLQGVKDLLIQKLVHCPAGDCEAICRKGRRLPLNDSMKAFCCGLPGSM